jgi:DNA helicase-2/ATP-dependent DNA helicase PcrA
MTSFSPTPSQEALLSLRDGCHLVHAPPGSGKTQVLTHRIIRLLEDDPDATFRILGLTFTTKAAETLRHRVRSEIGDKSNRVHASNFHSFCLDALRHYGHFVGFPSDTTVYDSDSDRLDVLARAVDEAGLHVPDRKELRNLLERIGVAKRALREPESLAGDPFLAEAYAAYDVILRRYHACDFDDLLWLTWKMMIEEPKVARHYRRLYRYIMVDEAQDTSRAQYQILKAICGDEHRNVMMVADSDQFIYRFAGASDKWLEAFMEDFEAQRHNLIENFRCAQAVIDAANKLVEHKPKAVSRVVMSPAKPAPGSVRALSYADEDAEAEGVVAWAQGLLTNGLDPSTLYGAESPSVAPDDVCILSRNRYALDAVIKRLEVAGLPMLFRAGRQLVETPEAQLVVQGMKALQNPADVVTRESILARWAEELLEAGVAQLGVPEFLARLATSAPSVRGLVDSLRTGPRGDVASFIRGLAGQLRTLGDEAREAGNVDRAALLAADAEALLERWDQYAGHTLPEARSIGGLLGEIALGGKSIIEGPGIRVLTVHVAKGLEFKAVALVGMNEGTLPDYRSSSQADDLSDELRIAYVGVTRASRALLLTRPRIRMMPWGDLRPQTESRFVAWMGLTMKAM